jgi:DNA-binding transcriptional regulator YiaG
MTGAEFQAAREQLGLTQDQFSKIFHVSLRTVGGWEQGERNGTPQVVPLFVSLLMKVALKYPGIRRELGIPT